MGTEILAINEVQIMLRLLVAAVLGAVIGYERERQNQPAGLRTHTILVVGSALAMTLSINLAVQYKPLVQGDPARLAAQVISGIGFLGAGAILRFGTNIRGLTTATSLWTLAVVGLAVGAGHIIVGVATTVMLLIVLTLVDQVEKRFIKSYKIVTVNVNIADRDGILDEIRRAILNKNTTITETTISRDLANDLASFNLVVRTLEDSPVDEIVRNVLALQGVKSFKIG